MHWRCVLFSSRPVRLVALFTGTSPGRSCRKALVSARARQIRMDACAHIYLDTPWLRAGLNGGMSASRSDQRTFASTARAARWDLDPRAARSCRGYLGWLSADVAVQPHVNGPTRRRPGMMFSAGTCPCAVVGVTPQHVTIVRLRCTRVLRRDAATAVATRASPCTLPPRADPLTVVLRGTQGGDGWRT